MLRPNRSPSSVNVSGVDVGGCDGDETTSPQATSRSTSSSMTGLCRHTGVPPMKKRARSGSVVRSPLVRCNGPSIRHHTIASGARYQVYGAYLRGRESALIGFDSYINRFETRIMV